MPRACAASSKTRSCSAAVTLGSARAAIWRAAGASCVSTSSRLPSSSVARKLMPVVLPPGWASEVTNPLSTKSSANGDDRDRPGHFLHHTSGGSTTGQDRVDPGPDELRCDLRSLLDAHGKAADDPHVLAVDKSRPTQLVEHRRIGDILAWQRRHYAEPIDPAGLLRAADRGVEEYRAAEQEHQLAASHSIGVPQDRRQVRACVGRITQSKGCESGIDLAFGTGLQETQLHLPARAASCSSRIVPSMRSEDDKQLNASRDDAQSCSFIARPPGENAWFPQSGLAVADSRRGRVARAR